MMIRHLFSNFASLKFDDFNETNQIANDLDE